jgi:hypothetical protein
MFLETALLRSVRDIVQAASAVTVAAPTVSGDASTSDTTPTWTWTIPSGAVAFRYQQDGEGEGTWAVVGGGVASYTPASPLTLGPHTLYVQAGSSAGTWSASGSHTITITIEVAGNITATQGTSTAQVSLSWDSVDGATAYHIYRDTAVTPPASELGNTAVNTYNDTSATPGQLYNYWVRAEGSMGPGEYSSSVSGYRRLGSTFISDASNGTSTAHIVVTFGTPVTGATSYQLYRSIDTTPPIDSTTPTITGIASSPYQDTGASAGVAYYYWVRAASSSSSSTSAWSAISDLGYRGLATPVLSLNPYLDDGEVSLDWPVVPGATTYTLERRRVTLPSTSFTPIASLGAGQTWYLDYPGGLVTFEYRLYASCPLDASEWSNTISVYTNIAS